MPATMMPNMDFAPKHDWKLFDSRCREALVSQWISRTNDEDWALYRSLFDFAASQNPRLPNRMTTAHWHEKMAIRRKLVAAFSLLDEMKRGSRSANNSDGLGPVAP